MTAAGRGTPVLQPLPPVGPSQTAVPGPASGPGPFGMVPHPGLNGELGSPGAAYAGLPTISPQMSAVAAAAVAAYGRTQVVRFVSSAVSHRGDPPERVMLGRQV